MDRTPGQIADSQSKRRVKYGLNVAVVILVAISLAVLVNWIGYRQFFRRDYTHGRKYSLSDQTRKVLDNLKFVLEASGSSLDKVVKTTVFCANSAYFGQINAIYREYFGDAPPARTFVTVGSWPSPFDIEIECIAIAA